MKGDFDQILYSWLGGYPKGQLPHDDNERIEAFKELWMRCKANGLEKSDLGTRAIGKVVTESINPVVHARTTKAKRDNWASKNNKFAKITFHLVYTDAVKQEENHLDPVLPTRSLEEVNIEEQIYEHNEKIPKTPKIIHDADTEGPPIESINEIDPEMALLMGFKIK